MIAIMPQDISRINLVRLMKPCSPVFRCSRDPHCRVRYIRVRIDRADRGWAARVGIYWNFCEPSGLGKTKQKNGPRCARNRLIIRLFVGELAHDGSCTSPDPVAPCLPIPFGGRSTVNYSRGALRQIYTVRSWRSSRMNRPKWIRRMNAFLFRLFNSRSRIRERYCIINPQCMKQL